MKPHRITKSLERVVLADKGWPIVLHHSKHETTLDHHQEGPTIDMLIRMLDTHVLQLFEFLKMTLHL
jgi:hypothetical protein